MAMSFRPRGLSHKGTNRPHNKNSFTVLEDNDVDVFLPNVSKSRDRLHSAPSILKGKHLVSASRGLALSERTNSSNSDDIQFKKPLNRPKPKVGKTLSLSSDSQKSVKNLRSNSVPTVVVPNKNNENMHCFSSMVSSEIFEDDLFPEPEIFRQIIESDDGVESPFHEVFQLNEIEMDENVEVFSQNVSLTEAAASINISTDDEMDEFYPEIERFPIGYASINLEHTFQNHPDLILKELVCVKRDEPSYEESPTFLFESIPSLNFVNSDECIYPSCGSLDSEHANGFNPDEEHVN